jgi:hypothetical protein
VTSTDNVGNPSTLTVSYSVVSGGGGGATSFVTVIEYVRIPPGETLFGADNVNYGQVELATLADGLAIRQSPIARGDGPELQCRRLKGRQGLLRIPRNSGAKARYRVFGKVNGSRLRADRRDGQVSGGGNVGRFSIKIKIWDGSHCKAVVYDNQMNAADGADPTTEIGCGSIVIHKK